ncbi:MAG: hypothetical protein ACFFAJ_08880 [Candidatus Hodarchaeota archaeon]
MKKLKCVFIDFVDDRKRRIKQQEEGNSPYSTFQEYLFNQQINSRVSQLFGWTTTLIKELNDSYKLKICIHIITLDFLRRHGVTQHFYSPHGPDYDDKFSYLHGMNILTFEGYNRVQLIFSIKRICRIFQSKQIPSASMKRLTRRNLRRKTSNFDLKSKVPVDHPRIGILIPNKKLNEPWAKRMKDYKQNVTISNDIRDLIPYIDPDDFIDYSLSRNYQYTLDDYIHLLNSILEIL